MSGLTLYTLTGRFFQLLSKSENEELTPEEVQEQYNDLCEQIIQKSTGLIGWDRNLEHGINAIDAEITRLSDMKRRAVKARDGFRDYVKRAMEAMGYTEIPTEIGKLRISKNPPSVDVLEPEKVPTEYQTATLTVKGALKDINRYAAALRRHKARPYVDIAAAVDKKAIMAIFKETGEIVPGTMPVLDRTRLDIK